ncbi:TrmH family RNA methyltransferase [Mycobacterium sherrisii]|uniref:RNA methyltransferase n=1 Tax=Mycobacterium sherrisii TaxID=243061 RepID=A0A1E3SG42_9MYCO|nr:RNA methyltransferase [Mycobacterium sherrisii]MCV7027625.1 RNA methyltransferase [Mycobacterium sherrisii]MEC4765417.1 RNA methyltransferase [Mycobacterium sherrisii]ODR01136.1 RNA methyltransferase [Mycobacterium sherrisii]ORW77414.1 RNA methyltransferase [Mycobacterium sherrisii]
MLTERSARVAAAVKLHRHVGRRRAQQFLAEGPNLVGAAAARGLVRDVFVTEAAAQRHAALLATQHGPVHVVTERAAKALSDTVTPAGLVAVCDMPAIGLRDALAGSPQLVAVAVEISEPGNAGTLIRLADAMGAAAVILAGHSVDPFNGKCLRASAGSIFSLPVVTAPEIEVLLTALRAAGLHTLATTVDGGTRLDEAGELLAMPTAWLFGPESRGLPEEITEQADHRVRIPMSGGAESLNVAAAAAICLYQSAQALGVLQRF